LRSKTEIVETKITHPELIDSGNILKTNNTALLGVSGVSDSKPLKVGKACFTWLKTTKNPNYLKGVHPLKTPKPNRSFESCLLNDKCATFERKKHTKKHPKNPEIDSKNAVSEIAEPIKNSKKPLSKRVLAIAKEPKYLTQLQYIKFDSETAEFLGFDVYETDSFKTSNASKIRTMDVFCNAYNHLYAQKRVSLLFHTFTRANASNRVWSDFLKLLLKRYKRLGLPVLGYVWVLEVGETKGMIHYHLAIAINRTRFKSIPKQLKLENVWGSRTEIDFVKKNVRHYLAKYFAKNRARVLDLETNKTVRSLGKSKTFKLPYLYSKN
jgi:hypothetical protein